MKKQTMAMTARNVGILLKGLNMNFVVTAQIVAVWVALSSLVCVKSVGKKFIMEKNYDEQQ